MTVFHTSTVIVQAQILNAAQLINTDKLIVSPSTYLHLRAQISIRSEEPIHRRAFHFCHHRVRTNAYRNGEYVLCVTVSEVPGNVVRIVLRGERVLLTLKGSHLL